MDDLHFISNNILTKFFKELIKYKMTINSILIIYIGIKLCILLYIFKCIHAYVYIFIDSNLTYLRLLFCLNNNN